MIKKKYVRRRKIYLIPYDLDIDDEVEYHLCE